MAPNDVNFRLSGDSGDAQRAWLEVIGVLKQTQAEIGKMGQRLETATKRGNQAMEKQITILQRLRRSFDMLRNANAVIGGLRTAWGLLSGEIDSVAESTRRLSQGRLSYEQALLQLMPNTMVSTGEFERVRETIEQYGGGTSREFLATAISAAASAEGLGLPKEDIARAAIDIVRMFPQYGQDQESVRSILMSAVAMFNADPSVQAQTAEGRPDFSRAIGFMSFAQLQSAQYDPQMFSQYTVPAALQLVQQYGYTLAEAFSELAAVGTQAKDRSGRITGTSALTIAQQIASIGARYGVGVRGEGRFDNREIMEWMQEGATDEARQARQELFGVFDVMAAEGGQLVSDAGDLQGAARIRGIYRNYLQNIGTVADLYEGAVDAFDPTVIEREMAARRELMESDRFAAFQREEMSRTVRGELSEIERRRMTLGEYVERREDVYDVVDAPAIYRNAIRFLTMALPLDSQQRYIADVAAAELYRRPFASPWERIQDRSEEANILADTFATAADLDGALRVRVVDQPPTEQIETSPDAVVPSPDTVDELGE